MHTFITIPYIKFIKLKKSFHSVKKKKTHTLKAPHFSFKFFIQQQRISGLALMQRTVNNIQLDLAKCNLRGNQNLLAFNEGCSNRYLHNLLKKSVIFACLRLFERLESKLNCNFSIGEEQSFPIKPWSMANLSNVRAWLN